MERHGVPIVADRRHFLGEMRVPYEWIDVDDNQEAQDYITELNADKRIIPTIVFEDGSFVSEPTNAQLAQKLGIEPKAKKSYYDLIIIGAGPAGLAASVYTSREGLDTLSSTRAPSVVKPGPPSASRTIPASPTASAATS